MSFRTSFFGDSLLSSGPTRISYGENILINTVDRGLTAQVRQAEALNQQLEATFMEGVERYSESQEESAQIIAREIRWQGQELRREISALGSDITAALDTVGRYLGAELAEVRWAIERNTDVTRRILEVELKSHWNDSRQFYEEGVQCYEHAERDLAQERFEKAVDACKTNGFAYEYLGFLAAHRDDARQALRYFDLAGKFAPNNHHRGFANYHMARAFHASGDENMSAECARAAVECDTKNTLYRYELVQALMRKGATAEAIVELRTLIHLDLKYWSVSAFHRLLDPIRQQVTDLLDAMREEQRKLAESMIAQIREALLKLDAANDGSLTTLIDEGRARLSTLQQTYAQGKVFDYIGVLKQGSGEAQHLVEQAEAIYRTHIAESQAGLQNLLNSIATEDTVLDGRISQLRQWHQEAQNAADASEAELAEKCSEADKKIVGKILVSGALALVFFWMAVSVARLMLPGFGFGSRSLGSPSAQITNWQPYIFPMIVTASLAAACLFSLLRSFFAWVRKRADLRTSFAQKRKEFLRQLQETANQLKPLEERLRNTQQTRSTEIQKHRQKSEKECTDWQDKISAMQDALVRH